MAKAVKVLHGFEAAIETAKADIAREQGWADRYPDDEFRQKELAERKTRLKAMRKMRKQFADRPYIQKMDEIVQKEVERYHADFYYHDLYILTYYEGRFAWAVGDCGTHFMKLDAEDDEAARHMRAGVEAVANSYGRYTVYEVDQAKGTIKKTSFDRLHLQVRVVAAR